MTRFTILLALALFLDHATAGQIRLTLGFESDPVGAVPTGASVWPRGAAYATNAPVWHGRQSLALAAQGQGAHIEWPNWFGDVFGQFSEQIANPRRMVTCAAQAGQTNEPLDLLIGTCGTETAVRIRFTPQGSVVAMTADGPKPLLAAYRANAWYLFTIDLSTADPHYTVTISNDKGATLASLTNLPWLDLSETNAILMGFAFSAGGSGKLFVDDLRVQDVDPTTKKPWPRKIVEYPKEGR